MEPREGLAACSAKRVPLHFSVILRPWVLALPRGTEPATSQSAVKRSTDWASPARAIYIIYLLVMCYSLVKFICGSLEQTRHRQVYMVLKKRLWQNMKLNDLLALTVKQLTSLKANGLYLLRILFEIGYFSLTACLIVMPICHNCLQ